VLSGLIIPAGIPPNKPGKLSKQTEPPLKADRNFTFSSAPATLLGVPSARMRLEKFAMATECDIDTLIVGFDARRRKIEL